jgi:hypothetical protein
MTAGTYWNVDFSAFDKQLGSQRPITAQSPSTHNRYPQTEPVSRGKLVLPEREGLVDRILWETMAATPDEKWAIVTAFEVEDTNRRSYCVRFIG